MQACVLVSAMRLVNWPKAGIPTVCLRINCWASISNWEPLAMKRDVQALTEQEFDVLVIGSGIYGAFLTREAAMRGLRVAMIEKNDFGAATSANSLKVVHGGLRYLQHLNWVRMRESIRARRQLFAIAPYLVRPHRFLVPTFGYGLQSMWIMRAALLLNDI
ncbi:MAG TPA: hypothetical protein DDW55_02385, partial [Gammaproteobacteria bacterium]|nr:hypothetical protein [Gammaproteobacteria bacterium]